MSNNVLSEFKFKEGDLLKVETYQFTPYSDTGDEESKTFFCIIKEVEWDNMNDDWIHYHLHSTHEVSSAHWDGDEWYLNYHFDFPTNTRITRIHENEFKTEIPMETYEELTSPSEIPPWVSKNHNKTYSGVPTK